MVDAVAPGRALASLQAQYPMLSMIFVVREVLQLKRLGWNVDVASINDPDRALEWGLVHEIRQELFAEGTEVVPIQSGS